MQPLDGLGQTGSVPSDMIARTSAPSRLDTLWTQPGGRRDAGPALLPRAVRRIHVEAPRRVAHGSSTSTAPSTTRTG